MSLSDIQREATRAVLEKHARTFSLAAKFLSEETADHAAAVYAWCRRADDAIDEAPRHGHFAALAQLHAELDLIFGDEDLDDPVLGGFQVVVRERGIRRVYCDELLAGMEMDAADVRYETLADLMVYCYRVAGTVGLMMAHVLGVRDDRALPAAAHLGMAMQLTNICRDVDEDHARKRCYLPADRPRTAGERGDRGRLRSGLPGGRTFGGRPRAPGTARPRRALLRRRRRRPEVARLAQRAGDRRGPVVAMPPSVVSSKPVVST